MKWNILLFIFLSLSYLLGESQQDKKVEYYIDNGKYLKAIDLIKTRIVENPKESEIFYKLGKIYQSLSMYNESIPCFKKVIQIDSTCQKAKFSLANSYMKSDKYYLAVIEFHLLLQNDSDNITVKKSLAELYFENKDYKKAREIFLELLEIKLLENSALINIGLCELKLNNIKESLNYFEKAYKQNPTNLKTVLLLVQAYQLGNSLELAEQVLAFELKKYPQNQKLLNEYAYTLFHGKKFQKALKEYSKLQEDQTKAWERYQKMGICYYYLDKPKYAELMLTHSLKKDSTSYLTNYYLGLSKMEMEKYKEANHYLEKTIKLSTPSFFAETYMRKAICDEQLQKYDQSMENYIMASKFAPNRNEIYYYIATLTDKHFDNIDMRIKNYRQFLENCEDCDIGMINYAEVRLQELNEEKIMGK